MPCTICWPSRVMAPRRSVRDFPELLKAAELAVCRTRAARRGSAGRNKPSRQPSARGTMTDSNSRARLPSLRDGHLDEASAAPGEEFFVQAE